MTPTAHETHELAPGLFASRYVTGRLEHYELADDRAGGDVAVIALTTPEMVALGARLWEWMGSRASCDAALDAALDSAPAGSAVDHPPETAT